ncbi:trimethylamine methyltransferase family protein [Mesorhizobium sp. BAC0120]|uniref:trimethylamine methyltransferase family protein n=1 Tax=Mesorhizobium sp. BAC0120 TaxID=3090670 RepID=UPI00298CAEE5|nr:trimethylamine methyltransferase family protein [Mesorhizobium sp. BAC0120]MDW6024920.1 trimethylamine methyltransferase family protein [Mesorhizobium sp. BAC0120]
MQDVVTPGEAGSSPARSRGRAARLIQRGAQEPRRPYISRRISTFNILDEEGLSLIEANADRLLKEIGMEFHDDPEILDLFRDAGADVKGTRVRFEPGMCRKIVRATAPQQFKQHARNPANTVVIGGDNTVLCPSWGPPFVHDLDRGRRYATLGDFRDLVRIHQMIPHLHHSGGVVCEPVDLPANKRHLDMLYTHIRYSDRPFMGAFIGSERAQDAVDIAKILFGEDFVANNAVLYNVSNTNAPLVLDSNMSGSLKVYARNNQPVACTPWTLAGAMSPCTVAGTLAQVLAEALACLSLVQLINPGAPCLMGSFASTISMQSGAPTFGTPEAAKMVLAAGQLARRLGVPFHTVGSLSASKLPDAQAEQEGTWGLLMSLFAGANVINHATGWLEGGLVTGFEKTIIDADLCGKVTSLFEGIDLSPNAQAMEAIAEVGPGSHFLGSAHTQSNFLSAFYRSTISDNNSFEQWNSEGGLDAAQRANRQWKKLLSDYIDPGLDPAIDEELQAFIAKRKASMPDQDYF